MKYALTALVLIVSLIFIFNIEAEGKHVSSEQSNINYKRATNESKFDDESQNPCNQIISLEMPDYRKPGRNISETKCLEYIWEIKRNEDSIKRDAQCEVYKMAQLTMERKPLHSRHFIIGGHPTQTGDVPHVGALGWRAVQGDWIFKCGGTVISKKFMVTAAHCSRVSSKEPDIANPIPEIVRIGGKNLNTPKYTHEYPKDVKIVQVIKHPNFDPPKKYFDIALIELESELYFNRFVQPACLWNDIDTTKLGTKASVAGWGLIRPGGRDMTAELQVGDINIISGDVCKQLLQPLSNRLWLGLKEHQMCAGVLAGGVDACQGDSGGPLQVPITLPYRQKLYYLLGVTSFGFGCARSNAPGVYTRVASFINWIEGIVWKDEEVNRSQ